MVVVKKVLKVVLNEGYLSISSRQYLFHLPANIFLPAISIDTIITIFSLRLRRQPTTMADDDG